MAHPRPKLEVAFFRAESGVEPVRLWLRALPRSDRRAIGRQIRTVQFGWPVGMPVVRKLEESLWEIRLHLDRRTARVIFTVVDSMAILVHGFIKKGRKISKPDLAVARQRVRILRAAGPY
jgi:phage-related protein